MTAVSLLPATHSRVKNGRENTLNSNIARKLAASTTLFVSHWKLGQILVISSVHGVAGVSGCRTNFPESEHCRPRAKCFSGRGRSVRGRRASSCPVAKKRGCRARESCGRGRAERSSKTWQRQLRHSQTRASVRCDR